jgi:peroxiredoxin
VAVLKRAFAALIVIGLACGRAPIKPMGPAPDFTLPDLAGGTLSLASLKGKVLVLDFWATWCGPCIKEMPSYAEFWRRNKERGVEVIGLIFDSGEPNEIQDFVRQHRIPYRQLLGTERVLSDYGATFGFPTTFVVDASGVIRSKTLGSDPDKFTRLQQEVDAALAGH